MNRHSDMVTTANPPTRETQALSPGNSRANR
jgi:hypothetical protein